AARAPEAPTELEAAPDPVPAPAVPEAAPVAATIEVPSAPQAPPSASYDIAQRISAHPWVEIGFTLARQHKMWVVSASLVIAAAATGGFLYSSRHSAHAAAPLRRL